MDDNNKPQRGLEKVSHFFLSEEIPSNQDPDTPGGKIITNETAHLPASIVHQHAAEYHRLKKIVARLYVLRESCKGNDFAQNPDNDIIWLKGAEDILQDAIANLIKTLRFIDNNNK